MENLTLISEEKDKIVVKKSVAVMSELVKTMADTGFSPHWHATHASPLSLSINQSSTVLFHSSYNPLSVSDKTETEIPLPNVKTSVLKKVVKYLTYHTENPAKEIEKPLKSANMAEVVSQWDADFVDVEQEELFELILVCTRLLFWLFRLICNMKVVAVFLHFALLFGYICIRPFMHFRLLTTWTSSPYWI